MPRLSKSAKHDWAMFIDPATGRRKYNDLCRRCCKTCKQSPHAVIIVCPRYIRKRSYGKSSD